MLSRLETGFLAFTISISLLGGCDTSQQDEAESTSPIEAACKVIADCYQSKHRRSAEEDGREPPSADQWDYMFANCLCYGAFPESASILAGSTKDSGSSSCGGDPLDMKKAHWTEVHTKYYDDSECAEEDYWTCDEDDDECEEGGLYNFCLEPASPEAQKLEKCAEAIQSPSTG